MRIYANDGNDMNKPKFNIGDTVYSASCRWGVTYITCPDCGGEGRLRVIFHDGEEVSIGCQNCARGYEPPTGRMQIYDYIPEAIERIITGMEISDSKSTSYKAENYILEEENLFQTQADAMGKAKELQAELEKQQQEKINNKEKPTRTWAWNASYHRREIKRQEKSIEYHKASLAVANLKNKEAKK